MLQAESRVSTQWWSSAAVRRAGLIVSLLLLGAALMMVWRQRAALNQAWHAVASAPANELAVHIAIVGGSVIANLVLSGLVFTLLMSRYGKVGLMEMQALIWSATLLNFVPLRPGLFGRVAYHKVHNDIAITDSAKVVVQAMGLSALAAGYFAAVLLVANAIGPGPRNTSPALTAGGLAMVGVLALMFLSPASWRIWVLAFVTRALEVAVGAARYWAAFALIGSPIDMDGALAIACISMIASMVPVAGNGLGVREWAVGLAAPMLTTHQMELGITADLLNRAAEIVVAVAFGLSGMAYLLRQRATRVVSSSSHARPRS